MLSPYLKRIIIDVLLFIALALGVFYVYKVFIDFLISLFHFDGTVNIPSIMYCVQRTLYILIPLIMLTAIEKLSKMKIFKVIFFTIGVCYLLANTWVIYYALNNPPIDLIYGSIPRWFSFGTFGEIMNKSWENLVLYQYNNALVFNYLIWDSYDLFGILFSTIQGILYIQLSLILDTNRVKVMRKLLVIFLLSFILPWIYNLLVRKQLIFSSTWASKNILLIFETFFVFVALNIAASSRSFWHDVLW